MNPKKSVEGFLVGIPGEIHGGRSWRVPGEISGGTRGVTRRDKTKVNFGRIFGAIH